MFSYLLEMHRFYFCDFMIGDFSHLKDKPLFRVAEKGINFFHRSNMIKIWGNFSAILMKFNFFQKMDKFHIKINQDFIYRNDIFADGYLLLIK